VEQQQKEQTRKELQETREEIECIKSEHRRELDVLEREIRFLKQV